MLLRYKRDSQAGGTLLFPGIFRLVSVSFLILAYFLNLPIYPLFKDFGVAKDKKSPIS